jgi:hypothetical protein
VSNQLDTAEVSEMSLTAKLPEGKSPIYIRVIANADWDQRATITLTYADGTVSEPIRTKESHGTYVDLYEGAFLRPLQSALVSCEHRNPASGAWTENSYAPNSPVFTPGDPAVGRDNVLALHSDDAKAMPRKSDGLSLQVIFKWV